VLSLLFRRRQRLARRDSEADRLIESLGLQACATAARLAREANDFWTMRYWLKVQEAIARKTDSHLTVPYLFQTMIYERPREGGYDFGLEIARHIPLVLPAYRASDRRRDVMAYAERVEWAPPDDSRTTIASASRPRATQALTRAR
jgi:hypothetical protein